jgi:1-deoxy-D-xylulose-5-phosphate reductoisomerase
MKKKTIAILGSTGSIGQSTLEIIKKSKKFKVVIIIANKNYIRIKLQIKNFKPKIVVITDLKVYLRIKKEHKSTKIIFLNNLIKINNFIKKIDITISAIPGIAGLEPTICFTKLSKKILLANKEAIVCGWDLIKKKAIQHQTKIIPIDSEHFSIGRLIDNYSEDDIEKIYITASGGPFLKLDEKKFKNIKPSDAIKHPKWKMGKKISVDSATLMNKVLELSEALRLFPFDYKKYEIIIHPQSLVHAIIKLRNGTSVFLYHITDMKIPIGNALLDDFNYFKFFQKKNTKLDTVKNLEFYPVDKKKFPVVSLIPIMNARKSAPIIINAANEIFVDQFLKNNIHFNSISTYLNLVLKDKNYIKTSNMSSNSIKSIYRIDNWSRNLAYKIIEKN